MDNPFELVGALSFGLIGLLLILFFARPLGTQLATIFGFFIQIFLSVGAYLVLGLRDDQLTYYNLANKLALELQVNPLIASAGIVDGKQSFVWLLAIGFLIWGTSPLPGLAANAVMLSALPTILVAAGRNLKLITSGKLTAWISILAPPILLWGPGLKREPLVFVLLALLLLGLGWAYQGRAVRSITLVVAVSLAMSVTRSSLLAVVAVVAVLVVSLLLRRRSSFLMGSGKIRITGTGRRIIASMAVGVTFLILPLAFRLPLVSNIHRDIVELSEGQSTAVPYSAWEVQDSLFGLLEYVVRALYNFVRSIIGPMPWEVVNLPLLIFSLDGAIYVLLFTVVAFGYFSKLDARGRGAVKMLVLAALPLVIANFLFLANYGLASRVRAHVFLMLLIVFEAVLEEKLHLRKHPSLAIYLCDKETQAVESLATFTRVRSLKSTYRPRGSAELP